MTKQDTIINLFEQRAARRQERREFLTSAGATGLAVAGTALLSACGGNTSDGVPSSVATVNTSTTATADYDASILNFALNLEYLEASFYAFAVTGSGLPSSMMTGTGTQGTASGGRAVTFSDPVVARYAREIAADEVAHVAFLRTALGSAAVAMPNLDISAAGAFSTAARAAGVITGSAVFDPYSSDDNFVLGGYIFEDVGVTAYKGAAPLLTNKTYVEASAGILAVEAYHAGLLRTLLSRRGLTTASIITTSEQISDARDSLDGAADLDQGIRPTTNTITSSAGASTGTASNIVPTDANGLAFSRTPGQVLNIVYLKTASASGGFFPNGVNGVITTGV